MDERDMFSLLFKWAKSTKRRDDKTENENYCTQGLTIVLSQLLNDAAKQYRSDAVRLMNSLFADRIGFRFNMNEKIAVEAQKKKGRGIPDLAIKTENNDKLIIIEVKVDSPVDKRALDSLNEYRKTLSRDKARNKGLVLITRFGDARHDNIDLEQISWLTLAGVLRRALEELERREGSDGTKTAGTYLLGQFCEFLKEAKMSLEKVNSQIDALSAHSMISMLAMLEAVCKELKLAKKLSVGRAQYREESWLGYKCSGGKYSIGLWGDKNTKKPIQLYFEIHEKDRIRRIFKSEEQVRNQFGDNAEFWEDEPAIGCKLNLKSAGFFEDESDEAEQTQIIKNFVKQTLKKWSEAKRAKTLNR